MIRRSNPIVAVMVHVDDVAAALRWYERAFPQAKRHRIESLAFDYLSVDGVNLEFVPADEKVTSGPCGTVVYWGVPNVGSALTHLQSLGAKLYRGPMQIGDDQCMCQLQDPWGNCIGLRGACAAS